MWILMSAGAFRYKNAPVAVYDFGDVLWRWNFNIR